MIVARGDGDFRSTRNAFIPKRSGGILPVLRSVRARKNVTQSEHRLLHPAPGGRIEAAQSHGVDLLLLVERLRLSPEERLDDLQRVIDDLEEIRTLTWSHDQAERDPSPAGAE